MTEIEAIKELQDNIDLPFITTVSNKASKMAIEALELKSKICHCKECIHWANGVPGCTEHVKFCNIGKYMVGENGYCVYGEKKNERNVF